MKSKIFVLAIIVTLMFSCGDDESAYTCDSCVDSPEAQAANDNTGKGIYKGLIIGSSGTIKINVANSGNTISAILEIDGETFNLTTSGVVYLNGFEDYFYGTKNTANDIKIYFWANSTGTEHQIEIITFPGHENAIIALYKELSTALVKVYEGSFSGDASGTFNMVVRDDEWLVRAREKTDDGYSSFYGTLSGGVMTCIQCGDVEITGKISGDECSGKWNDVGGGSGSWKGKRTL